MSITELLEKKRAEMNNIENIKTDLKKIIKICGGKNE